MYLWQCTNLIIFKEHDSQVILYLKGSQIKGQWKSVVWVRVIQYVRKRKWKLHTFYAILSFCLHLFCLTVNWMVFGHCFACLIFVKTWASRTRQHNMKYATYLIWYRNEPGDPFSFTLLQTFQTTRIFILNPMPAAWLTCK